MRKIAVYLYFILTWMLLFINCQANELNSKTHLQKVSQEIKGVENKIQNEKETQENMQQGLAEIEKKLSQINSDILLTQQSLKAENEELAQLSDRKTNFKKAIARQWSQLLSLIQLNYFLQSGNSIKTLLQEQKTSRIDRFLQYQKYLNSARVSQIKQIKFLLEQLQNTEQQLILKKQQLQDLISQQKKQQHQYLIEISARKNLLTNLNQRLFSQNKELSELQENKRALENLIVKINQAKIEQENNSEEKTTIITGSRSFISPVSGRVVKGFDNVDPQSGIAFNALEIKASMNTSVRAVANGQVVFADWFKGLGFLVIIQHAHNYMTLYGHLAKMAVKVGDAVSQGQNIAAVGNSGGNENSALYFQIRENGKPVNPSTWFHF